MMERQSSHRGCAHLEAHAEADPEMNALAGYALKLTRPSVVPQFWLPVAALAA
jgi:hypothetical protein